MDQFDKRAQGVQQKMTLDQAVIFGELQEVKTAVEDLKRALEELKERVVKTETDLGIMEAGYNAVYNALEINGLMSAGEPTKPVAKPEPIRGDPAKVVWTIAEGSKGPYQKSQDVNSSDFKALLKTLQEYKGKMMKDGYFMWVFQDGCTIGRKRRGKEC